MTAEGSVDLSLLVQHDALLRRLAARLAGPADADDAVQDTWLAALKLGGLRTETAKAWLTVALRRFVAGGRRAGARSRRREAVAARRDVAPSAAEIVEREAARREVVSALLELDPIYRDALLLRYESDLPPRRVAAALGIPVETARTRIKRGLATMRRRLDERIGPDRRASLALLFVRPAARAVALAAAGAVAAGILIAVTITIAMREPASPSLAAPAGAVAEAPPPAAADRPRVAPIRPGRSAEAAVVVLDVRETSEFFPCAEPRDQDGAHRFVATRVIDELTGAPVAGARVRLIDEHGGQGAPDALATAASDGDGWVRLRVEEHRDRERRDRALALVWSADGFAAGACSGAVPPFPIRLQRAGERVVRVVDAAGTPAAGAVVGWRVGAARTQAGSAATADAGGFARVRGIDAASGFVFAARPGSATAEIPLAAAEPGAPPPELVLLPARSVRGVELAARPGSRDSLVRVACAGADGAAVDDVPLCIVSSAGEVLRTETIATGGASARLSEGAYDVLTDDLDSATEVVPARFVVPPDGSDVDVRLDVVERPRVRVEIGRDTPVLVRVLVVTEDGAWSPGGLDFPVPWRGTVDVVLVDGAAREVRSVPEPRAPGAVITLRFEERAADSRPARVDLFSVVARDGSDRAVPGARVVVEGKTGPLAAITDARGEARFEASAVKEGAAVAAWPLGFAPAFTRADGPGAVSVAWPDTALAIVVKGPDPARLPPPVVIVDGEPADFDGGTASIAGLAPGEHVAIVAAAGWIPKIVRFELTGAPAAVLEVALREQPR
jgi:RNA polymerase sigma-70 factor (ECF subfamily)